MDKYTVKLYSNTASDLEEIYDYIEFHLNDAVSASKFIDLLENTILSLEQFPNRGSYRRKGAYAGHKYRQVFVKNYVIIYKVIEETKEVHVVTIRYVRSEF